jgi:hypothetical protein
VATQSFVEVAYGPHGLALIAMGIAPQASLDTLVSADQDRDIRQVAFVDTAGAVAAHTGVRCIPSCGSVVSGQSVAIGNMLASERVLPAMSEAYGAVEGELVDRLLAALRAGDEAGGDLRGRMSASLRVVSGEPAARSWQGGVYDLRADFGPDPLAELATHLRISRAYGVFFQSVFAPGLLTGSEPVTGADLDAALAGLDATQQDLGDDLEPTVWQGVLLLRAGQVERGAELISCGIVARPEFARFIDGLAQAGMISLNADDVLAAAKR